MERIVYNVCFGAPQTIYLFERRRRIKKMSNELDHSPRNVGENDGMNSSICSDNLDSSVLRELNELQNYNEDLRRVLDNKNEQQLDSIEEQRQYDVSQKGDGFISQNVNNSKQDGWVAPTPLVDKVVSREPLSAGVLTPAFSKATPNYKMVETPYPLPFLTPSSGDTTNDYYGRDLRSTNGIMKAKSGESPTSEPSLSQSKHDTTSLLSSPAQFSEVIRLRKEIDLLTRDRALLSGKLDAMKDENMTLRETLDNERREALLNKRTSKHSLIYPEQQAQQKLNESQFSPQLYKMIEKTEFQFKEQVSRLQNKILEQSREIEELYNKIRDIHEEKLATEKSLSRIQSQREESVSDLKLMCEDLKMENKRWKVKFEEMKQHYITHITSLKHKLSSSDEKIMQLDTNYKIVSQKLQQSLEQEQAGRLLLTQTEQQFKVAEQGYRSETNRLLHDLEAVKSTLQETVDHNSMQLDRTTKQYNDQIRHLDAQVIELKQKVTVLSKRNDELDQEKHKLSDQICLVERKRREAENTVESLRNEINLATRHEQEQNSSLKEQLDKEKSRYREAKESYDLKVILLQKQVTQLEKECDSLKNQNKNLQSEVSNSRKKQNLILKEYEGRVAHLSKELNTKRYNNFNLPLRDSFPYSPSKETTMQQTMRRGDYFSSPREKELHAYRDCIKKRDEYIQYLEALLNSYQTRNQHSKQESMNDNTEYLQNQIHLLGHQLETSQQREELLEKLVADNEQLKPEEDNQALLLRKQEQKYENAIQEQKLLYEELLSHHRETVMELGRLREMFDKQNPSKLDHHTCSEANGKHSTCLGEEE